MAYAPLPPPPFKRPYPEEWTQSGDFVEQGEYATPRSAKESKPPEVEGYDWTYDKTPREFQTNLPESGDSQRPPPVDGYSAWPQVETYAPRPPAEGYQPQQSSWDDYSYHYPQRLGASEGYPPVPPVAECYPPQRPTAEGYPPRSVAEGYPPRPTAEGYIARAVAEGYPLRPPEAEGYQPRTVTEAYPPRPAAEGYPTRPPEAEAYPPKPYCYNSREDYPPSPPLREDYPPRAAAREDYPPRAHPREDYPPRPPLKEDYPPRAAPREDYPPRAHPREDYLPRAHWPHPREDYLPRAHPREDYLPRAHPREDYPPRHPPREDYSPRAAPREDYPPRPPLREDYPPRAHPREDYPPRYPAREEYLLRHPPREDYPPRHPPREDYRQRTQENYQSRTPPTEEYSPRPPPFRNDYPERRTWDNVDPRSGLDHDEWDNSGVPFTDEHPDISDKGGYDDHRGNRGHWDFNRGRGNRGRGRGTESRGHFSQRRGEGRHIRGRGGIDRSPVEQRRDERGVDESPSWEEDSHYRGQGGGGRGRARGGYRGCGAPIWLEDSREYAGRGRGRYREKFEEGEDQDPEKMSLSEKFHKLSSYLRTQKRVNENAISTIKNGLAHTKIGLQSNFEAVDLGKTTGISMFTGTLKIGTVFLARGMRSSKKELRKEVFEKALNVLKTMSTPEIFSLIDPGEDTTKQQLLYDFKSESMKCEEELAAKEKSCEKKSENVQDHDETYNILTRMINAVLTMKSNPGSPVAVIEQAVSTACGLVLHDFQIEVAKMSNGLLFYRGKLSILSTVIGRGGEITKKKCKIETYKDAVHRLKTLSVDELMESVAEKPVPEVRCVGESEENPTLSRLLALSQQLKYQQPKQNIVIQLDVAALQKGLTPIVIFKQKEGQGKDSEQMICELYLGKIFITSCEGTVIHDCKVRVYQEAWELLLKANVEDIVSNNRCITDEEIKDPKLLDVIIKGPEYSLESNTSNLRKFGYDISESEKLDLKDIVIIEHNKWSNDRENNAFIILQYSCNQNGMILQWESFTKNYHKAVVSVQKQEVGESYGQTKNVARNLAAVDALYKLYETQDVLKIVPRPEDPQKWIPWSDIQDKADSLREEYLGEEPPCATDKFGNPLPDQFVMKVLKNKLEEFNKTKDNGEDELIIGPGIQGQELRELKLFSKSINLLCDSFRHEDKFYLLIYEKIPWKKMVEVLKVRDRPFGRFVLADRDELPKHKDIAFKVIKKLLKGAEEQGAIEKSDVPEVSDDEHEYDDELEDVNEPVKSVKLENVDEPVKSF